MSAISVPTGAGHMRRRSNAQAFRAEDEGNKGKEKRKALQFPKGGCPDTADKLTEFGLRNSLLCQARKAKAAGKEYADLVKQAAAIAPLTRKEAV
jgi:hypothetical protein